MSVSGRLSELFDQPRGFSPRLVWLASLLNIKLSSNRAFQRSEHQFQVAFEQAAVAMAHIALDGTCLIVNKRLCDMLGCARDELVSASLADLLHPSILSASKVSGDQSLSSEATPECIELPYTLKSGRTIWLNSCTSLVRDSSGQPQYWVLVLEDITIRKAYQEQLLLSHGVLRQFAYATAHDLQEPMRNVALSSELIAVEMQGRSDPQLEELLLENSFSAKRMQRMLKGLLAFTQAIDSDPTQILVADSEFALAAALTNLQAAITDCSAQVTHAQLPQVAVHPRHLLYVLEHLVGNAIKYRKPGQPPIVSVSAKLSGPNWLFQVCDDGIGFDPSYGRLIFGLFRQLSMHDEQSGTGIGLAVCARIVQHYGGVIWADSQLGDGATFSFTLPAVPSEPATPLHTPMQKKWSGPPSLASA